MVQAEVCLDGSVWVGHLWAPGEAFNITTLCVTARSGTDLSGGAAHFAAVVATAGLEDPCPGGKSSRSVPNLALQVLLLLLCLAAIQL